MLIAFFALHKHHIKTAKKDKKELISIEKKGKGGILAKASD